MVAHGCIKFLSQSEQRAILEQRGVLEPEEIHRLASKTKKAASGESSGPSCHSDHVDSETARDIQRSKGVEQIVSLNTSEVTNIPKDDSII